MKKLQALQYQLELLEPVLVTQLATGDENSAEGLNYIPGAVMRGVLIDGYLRRHASTDLMLDEEALCLFFDGAFTYLNAYPDYNQTRMLPTPLSWLAEKDSGDKATIFDSAFCDVGSLLKQPKAPGNADFSVFADVDAEDDEDDSLRSSRYAEPKVVCYSPGVEVQVHIALSNPNIRGEGNQVYRYAALARGQRFNGVIFAPAGEAFDELEALLFQGAEFALGGARSAGYGRVKVTAVQPHVSWDECPFVLSAGNRVVITLLSDAIIRGADGQVNGDLDAALSQLLGHPVCAKQRWQNVRRVGGYNRKWSLPLPHNHVLQAGSVFVYAANDVDAQTLYTKARTGIGEGCVEGFGRIAVNWQQNAQLKRDLYVAEHVAVPRALSPASQALAAWMAQRQLERQLEQGLIDFASTLKDAQMARLPSKTQLARIRNLVQQALDSEDLYSLKAFLDNLDQPKNARIEVRQQLQRAKLYRGKDESLLDWLKQRVKQCDVQTQLLGGRPLPRLAGVDAQLDNHLSSYYTARLIDVVMKKMIRQVQAQEGKSSKEVTQ